MNNNFFTMLFFTIGIIVTIKFILKTIIELRNHWASGGWKNKRECFFDYCNAKINKPVVVCKSVSSEKFYPQMADDYDDDISCKITGNYVNLNEVGDYDLTISAIDKSGNKFLLENDKAISINGKEDMPKIKYQLEKVKDRLENKKGDI